MTTQQPTQTEIYIASLTAAGFILPATAPGGTPDYMLFNELGVYIGEVLELKGWSKKSWVNDRNKTWLTFTSPDGTIEITHRDLNEFPEARYFSAKTIA